MKVYVVQRGKYEDRFIAGVYSSIGAAMAAYPGEAWDKYLPGDERSQVWRNDKDWDDFLVIMEFDVDKESREDA